MQPDINCDMGEGITDPAFPAGRDELIMPFITSANIACGYHAGDATTMRQTVELAIQYNVAIGAHPSFLDRENFGRIEMKLENNEVYDLVTQQLYILNEITTAFGGKLNHVKPHGALYNMAAKNTALSGVIAKAVKDFDASLLLFGLSGSHSISEANKIGLKTVSEVFADRTYQDNGTLTPRSQTDALLKTVDEVVKQVMQMVTDKTVTTVTGKKIAVKADTICIHSDGEHAVAFTKAIQNAINK